MARGSEEIEIEIPLAGGIKTRTNPHTIDAGDFRELTNIRFGKDSLLEKRFGYTALGLSVVRASLSDPATEVDSAYGLGTLDDELLLFGDRQTDTVEAPPVSLFTRSVADSQWAHKGQAPNAEPTTSGAFSSQATIFSSDIALTGSYKYVAAETDYDASGVIGIWVAVYDLQTNALVRGPSRVANDTTKRAMSPRFVVRDDGAVVLFFYEETNNIYGAIANAGSNRVFGVPVLIKNNAAKVGPNARPVFDACNIESNGTNYEINLAYASTAVDIKAITIDASLTVTVTTTTGEAGNLVYGIAVTARVGPSDKLYIAYTKAVAGAPVAAAMTYVARTVSGGAGPTTVFTDGGSGASLQHFNRVAVYRTDSTHAFAIYSFDGPFGSAGINVSYMGAAALLNDSTVISVKGDPFILLRPFAERLSLASRIFLRGTRLYAYGALRDVGSRSHTVLLDLGVYVAASGIATFVPTETDGTSNMPVRIVSSHAIRLGGTSSGAGATASIPSDTAYFERVPSVIVPASDQVETLCAVYTQAYGNGYTLSFAKDDFGTRNNFKGTKHGRSFFFSPGGKYDGQFTSEFGWLATPPAPVLAAGTGTGVTGTFNVSIVWAYVDINGDTHKSAPSPPATISLVNKANFDVTYAGVGSLSAVREMRAEIYVTEADGIIYYLAATPQAAYENPTSPFVYRATVNITATTVTTNPIIYTQGQTGLLGGRLPNFGPGSLKSITAWKNRLWGIDDLGRIKYSNERIDGEEPMWSDVLVQSVDDQQLTAIGPTESGLAIFSATGTWMLFGEGPAENGNGASWSLQRVPTSVGCSDPNTVIQFGAGLIFGDGDLYCLNRGMVVTDLGGPVHDLYTLYPNAKGKAHVSHSAEVRIELESADGTEGVAVVWDEIRNAWHVHDRHDDDTGSDLTPSVGATYWNGCYVWAVSTGRVYVETPFTGWLDGTSYVPSTVMLPYVKDRNLQSMHRKTHVVLLGEWLSPHQLTVDFQHDYLTEWIEPEVFQHSDMAAVEAGTYPYQFEIQMKTQKVEATSIRIRDAKPVAGSFGSGQGASWTSVLAKMVQMEGAAGKLLPPAQRR